MTLRTISLTAILTFFSVSTVEAQQLQRFSVHFEVDAAAPNAVERSRLDSLLRVLPASVALKLTGHTDSTASQAYNLRLSQHRTEWVKGYLIAKGIQEKLLVCDWRGESAPLRADGSKLSHALNRRVEISWAGAAPTVSRSNISDFYFDADLGLDTLTADQVRISIPAHSLLNRQGALVHGNVHVRFQNFKDRVDQIQADMSLDFEDKGKWYLYNSVGMFGIYAFQEKDSLALLPGTKLRIEYPLRKNDRDCSFFRYVAVEKRWQVEEKTALPSIPETEKPKVSEPTYPVTILDPRLIEVRDSSAIAEKDSVSTPPDSLYIDTLYVPLPDNPLSELSYIISCDSCDCKSATFIEDVALCISLDPPSKDQIDLRFSYLSALELTDLHDDFCNRRSIAYCAASTKKSNVLRFSFSKPSTVPRAFHGDWKISKNDAKRSAILKHGNLDDIAIRQLSGRKQATLILRGMGVTEQFKARYLGERDLRAKDLRTVCEDSWQDFVAKNSQRTPMLDSNLYHYVSHSDCSLGLPYDPEKSSDPFAWLQHHLPILAKLSSRYLDSCSTCCYPPPIIPRWDSVTTTFVKTVLIEGGAIPIVMLDDFGLFNYDAIDSLPNPIWLTTQFLDGNGQPISAWRIYLLVGEINGVIQLPWGTGRVRISPAMRNQFVLLDYNGSVHYCTDAVFSAALQQGGNVITVPCVTVPHTIGEPPLDLRKVLPFQ